MQVHHGFDIKDIGTDAVNDGIGKTVKVKLAVIAPDFAPAFRRVEDTVQRRVVFVQKIAAKAG